MLDIHTIEFKMLIPAEEETRIIERMKEYEENCVRYDKKRKRYVFDGFSDQGLRIFLWKRTNEVMHRERQLEYVLNPQAVLKNGEVRYAFYGNEKELDLALYRAEQMLYEAGLPRLKKENLERMDLCIDISYDCEKKTEEAMRLVRKHGIPRKYENFYKGTSYNNRYSFEVVRKATGERLVIYDKTHQLKELGVNTENMYPTIRVEYKANRKSRNDILIQWEGMNLMETILVWRELSEGALKYMVDDLLTSGIHRKHEDLMEQIRQGTCRNKNRLSARESAWMEQVTSLFEILRNKNQYHETIRACCAENQSNAKRWGRIEEILRKQDTSPVILGKDSPFLTFVSMRKQIYQRMGWKEEDQDL